jgi:hypothetical protein
MLFLGRKRRKFFWGRRKQNGMKGLGEGFGGEADFSFRTERLPASRAATGERAMVI